YVELDLKAFRGLVPQELFGRSQFPPIGEAAFPLTLGPHGFYWFALAALPATPLVVAAGIRVEDLPVLGGETPWSERVRGWGRDDIEALLPDYLRRRQFFRPEAIVTAATIQDAFPIRVGEREIHLLVIRAEFRAGIPEMIVLATTRVNEGEA